MFFVIKEVTLLWQKSVTDASMYVFSQYFYGFMKMIM